MKSFIDKDLERFRTIDEKMAALRREREEIRGRMIRLLPKGGKLEGQRFEVKVIVSYSERLAGPEECGKKLSVDAYERLKVLGLLKSRRARTVRVKKL